MAAVFFRLSNSIRRGGVRIQTKHKTYMVSHNGTVLHDKLKTPKLLVT